MGRSKQRKQLEPGKQRKQLEPGLNAHLHADTKVASAALDDLLSANSLAAADVKAYIDPVLQSDAKLYAKRGLGLPAANLKELQEGLAKLQAEGVAEGVAEGLSAAKAQQAQEDSQRKTGTKAALVALEGVLSANGLVAGDVRAHITPQLVGDAGRCAEKGKGLPAARLEELQQGLAKLQAEGVAEGLSAAKVQQAQADSQRKTGTKAALAALEGVLSAHGLAPADVKAYIDPQVVGHARRAAKQGRGLLAVGLGELQQGLAKLQAEGVVEGLAAAKAKAACEAVQAKEQVAAGLEVQAVKQEAEAVEREQNHRALVVSAAPPLGMADLERVVHVKEETQQRLQRLPPPPPPPPQQVDPLALALARVVSIKQELAHAEGQQPPAEPPGEVMHQVLCVKREVADTVTDTACTQNKRQKC
jgi:hypothetical protein